MSSVNKAILIGHLGRDPEIRSTQNGKRIANLSVATSERWKDKNSGEAKEATQWHRIVIFNDRICDVCEKYLKKGSRVYLEGSMETRSWTDTAGVEKYTTEVVIREFKGQLTLLDSKKSDGSTEEDPYAS